MSDQPYGLRKSHKQMEDALAHVRPTRKQVKKALKDGLVTL